MRWPGTGTGKGLVNSALEHRLGTDNGTGAGRAGIRLSGVTFNKLAFADDGDKMAENLEDLDSSA